MLGSITPLGERGRGSRWIVTFAAFAVGSVLASGLVGALLGVAGERALNLIGGSTNSRFPYLMLAAAILISAGVDFATQGQPRLGPNRQVSEVWLYKYRNWVYGLGFGIQLGAGVLTVIPTAALYVSYLAAIVSGSASAGALIGTVYGGLRALSLLSVSRVHDPQSVLRANHTLEALARPSWQLATLLQVVIGLALTAGLVR